MLRADLAQSPQLKVIPIHVTAAFHADHLELPDLQYIIGSSPLLQSPISERSCVMFGSGLRMESRSLTLQALLSEAVFEIFERPQDWLAIEKSLTEEVVGTKARAVFIGPSTGVSRLQKILETGPVPQSASLSTLLTEGSPELLQDLNAIAVVGMSGRFPGGDDVEGLWQVLVNGRDQCAQVSLHHLCKDFDYSKLCRYPGIDSMLRRTTIRQERLQIRHPRPMDASTITQTCSMHHCFACLHVKPLRPTLSSGCFY